MFVNYIPRDELTSLGQIPKVDPDVLKEIWEHVRGFLTDWKGVYYGHRIEASIGMIMSLEEMVAYCRVNSGRVVLHVVERHQSALDMNGAALLVYLTRAPVGIDPEALEGLG